MSSNPQILNLVPLFNVADPQQNAVADLNTSVTGIQTMIDYSNHTLQADNIRPYTAGSNVQMVGLFDITGGLTVNGEVIGSNDNGEQFIQGNSVFLSTGTTGIFLSNVATSNSNSPAISFQANNNNVFQIDALGRAKYLGDGVSSNVNSFQVSSAILHADRGAINLGGSSNMSTIFDVWGGDAYFDASVHVNQDVYCQNLQQVSDRRMKEDIQPLTGALSTVCALRGVQYLMGGKPSIGFIAQEVKEVIPEAVTQTESGTFAVDQSKIVPYLAEAIKQLTRQLPSS